MSVEKVEKVAEKVVEKGEQEQEKFEKALKKINVHKLSVLIPAIKYIITILQNLQKKPSEAKNRKLRTDNVAIKKFVSGVEGMQDFLEIVGYKATEVASKKFLEIEQETIDMTLLGRTIGILSNKLKEIESPDPSPPKSDKLRISCVGPDCKFWGDEKTENMCSVCYKKKYLGKAAVAAVTETKTPVLCIKDCGFYGLPRYQGMCSQCYSKDSGGRRKELKRRWRIAMMKIRAVRAFRLALRPVQKNRNRCWKCRRRVGIAGIECRCGYIFCGEHRYAGEHDCPYDFKKAHQQKLLKENLKLTGKKFDKIDSDGE